MHDQITVTISPAYFILAKGLSGNAGRLRLETTVLAAKAAYGPALISGALVLIANNPRKDRPPLPWSRLVTIALIPLGAAAVCAVLGGVFGHFAPPRAWLDDVSEELIPEAARAFVVVRGIHTGSYAGAALGTIVACVHVVRARGRAATLPEEP